MQLVIFVDRNDVRKCSLLKKPLTKHKVVQRVCSIVRYDEQRLQQSYFHYQLQGLQNREEKDPNADRDDDRRLKMSLS